MIRLQKMHSLPAIFRTSKRIWVLGLCLASLLWMPHRPVVADSAVSREDRIKAAIVYKLARYVGWPDNSFTDESSPFSMCVLGDGVFATALYAAEKLKLGDRPIRFRTVADVSQAVDRCHLLYVSRYAWKSSPELLAGLRSHPVLTISDAPDFAPKGGIIGLVKKGSGSGFEINLDQARQSNLKINTLLLDLASVVSGP